MNTKKCKECLEEINIKAIKCPKCQAYQRPIDRLLRSSYFALAIIPLFFIGSYYVNGREGPIYDTSEYLEIKDASYQFVTAECGQLITLIGTIENKSDKPINYITFDVEYFSKDGKLIDVINDNNYELVIPPKTSKPFKVSGKTGAEKSLYFSSKVSVSKARKDNW